MSESWREKIGDYRLTRELGRGAFGIVYEACQVGLNRQVALKVLPANLFPDQKSVERFRKEAIAAAQLRHPRIVTVHEAGQEGELCYFSMDLMPGRSLAEVIAERGGLTHPTELEDSHFTSSMHAVMTPADETRAGSCETDAATQPPACEEVQAIAANIVGVASALHYAHEKGVVHQDVKPSNLVFDDDGNLCLLDFGTAQIRRLRGDQDQATGGLGTPLYASPEQLRSTLGEVGPQTDIYSLGASLYEWLTLRPPFVAQDYAELRHMVLTATPTPPHELNPAVPRTLSAIVCKALARDLDARYATAQDFADDLRRFTRQEPTRAESAGPWRRFVLWRRRNRALAGSLAAAALLTVVVLGGVAYMFSSGQSLLDQARAHFALSAWLKCITFVDQIPGDSPDWPEAIILKAECFNQLERYQERLALYDELLAHHADRFDAHRLLLGRASALADEASAFADEGAYREAEESFRRAIAAAQNRTDEALAHYEYGRFLDDHGDKLGASREEKKDVSARAQYEKAIECDPELAKAHFYYGLLVARQGDRAKAEKSLKAAVDRRGEDKPKYLVGIAQFYVEWNKPNEALPYVDRVIELARQSGRARTMADYQVLKAHILVIRGSYEDAIVLLREAAPFTEKRVELLYLLTVAQFEAGKRDDARATAGQFEQPEDAICPAMAWAELGDMKAALRYFGKLRPNDFAAIREKYPILWAKLPRLRDEMKANAPAGYEEVLASIERALNPRSAP